MLRTHPYILTLDLSSAALRDRVLGCWAGKNVGGTLGAPLEEGWGKAEPFDVWWYPRLQEGGIPNDDLEMQLVWLKALEEVGPQVTSADLVQYWLDHIRYGPDEYGLARTNWQMGLLPPVAGAYNNWFRDCMGAPIRSELWACVTPGHPRLAARYAFEDAIQDHGGGEGLYGELFNAALQSAAFVVHDRDRLLDLALTYVPGDCGVARAVRAARDAHACGLTWLEARERVLEVTPHHVSQFAPINLGFQTIGWLYGEDFGDALCKTVNCGYDTDCSGATLGAILGLLEGKSGLPERWLEPLGERIALSDATGGLTYGYDGPHPLPRTLGELTTRVIEQARRVLAYHGLLEADGTVRVDESALEADADTRALWTRNFMRVDHRIGGVHVAVDYHDTPAITPGVPKRLTATLRNTRAETLTVDVDVLAPAGWTVTPAVQRLHLPSRVETSVELNVLAPHASVVENANRLLLDVRVQGRPAQPVIPVVLVGGRRYVVSSDHETLPGMPLDTPLAPEAPTGDALRPEGRPGTWRDATSPDNTLPVPAAFTGATYVRAFLWSDLDREVWLGVPSTCPARVWVNGDVVASADRSRPVRPNYWGYPEDAYGNARLHEGWNEVLVKLVRAEEDAPCEAHLILTDGGDWAYGHNVPLDVLRTRVPWEVQA
ncbi:ADP-ribosylglycohydrolase family protein [Deinococcus pimensis]|uniref:ADP-ribosylglycohydrolase family protein n=1 Tax=Deinococcus pimensis TaxID=309888 RepID=UPI0004B1F517|nr:ADP-ribosylglycohydrolase family protein [Deinococcus pimensis]